MWYTKPDNTDVVEGNPMKEKTYQTRCGTIHYWASVSNPDAITLVFLPGLTADHRFSISRTGIMLSSGMHRHTVPHGRFGLILICSIRQNG